MDSLILNIQKYSIHDGEGIRTTVFFKGCPLNCIWCHNPESQSYAVEILYNQEKCTSCGRCAAYCPSGIIRVKEGAYPIPEKGCERCGNCVQQCFYGVREMLGKRYSVLELMRELDKDKMFYEESGGGVTLSGGEVMTQKMDYLMEILKKCHQKGYPVNIDTCGYSSFEHFRQVFPYVDTFLYDLKHMDEETHVRLTGVGNAMILDNLRKLSQLAIATKQAGKPCPKINLRIPLIEGVNTGQEQIRRMIDFLSEIEVWQVNLLPYHKIGKSKYERIGKVYEGEHYKAPSESKLEEIQQIFTQAGHRTVVGG